MRTSFELCPHHWFSFCLIPIKTLWLNCCFSMSTLVFVAIAGSIRTSWPLSLFLFQTLLFQGHYFLANLKHLLSVILIERSYLWSLHVCLGFYQPPLLETSCPMITTIGLDSPLQSMSIWWESGSQKRNIDYHLDTWMWGWFFHLIIIHLINLCIAQNILKKSNLTNYVKK